MHDAPGTHEKQKAAKARLKPEREPVLRPTFTTSQPSLGETLGGHWTGSLLQRQCACGSYTSGGGECEACRQKREAGAWPRTATTPASQAVQRGLQHNAQKFGGINRLSTLTHFGPDFSQIPVQAKPNSAAIQRQCPCEAQEEEEKNQTVQTKQAGETANQAVVQRGIVDDIVNWIDLLEPKQALMDHMTDSSWIVNRVTEVEKKYEANPKHDLAMTLKLYFIGMRVGAEAQNFVNRIRDCNDRAQVDALRLEFDIWKAIKEVLLVLELEAQVEEYREIERGWLRAFAGASKTADPVHPNQSKQSVALTLKGGVPEATVIVETRVNCTFQLTTEAQKDNDGDGNPDVPAWTPDEQTNFMNRFQQQLNDVWSTGAGATAPFRCTAPKDHLLSDESPKWSGITAKMAARVTADATNPHFQLTVLKEAASESNRAGVNTGTGTFYLKNADAGYKATSGPDANLRTGGQHTLAHEWHHMIGNPDEYAENSAAQSGSASTPADLKNNWANCQKHFNDIINDPASSPEKVQQARNDLQALQNHATDVDPTTPGFQSGIFPLAGRTDIPDSCFAIRGAWKADQPGHLKLRPGAQSQRGGTNISASADDAARLSDRGNEVRPYMREGIIQELQKMLKGKFDPEVNFDHNFQDMTPKQVAETLQARIQNILHDIKDLGASKAPAGGSAPEDDHSGHEH